MTTSPSDGPGMPGRADVGTRRAYDVAVVGGGPAGMSAAVAAVDAGARVALIDGGSALGGQYWRHPPDRALATEVAGQHHGLRHYRRLARSIAAQERSGRLDVLTRHDVWTLERNGDHGFAARVIDRAAATEQERVVRASALVLAPGAYDRQVPFPGWTLPGVMTAGGVQALLKGSATVAGQRVLVAGTGPFLLPVAAGLASAGATVVGVHEASSTAEWASHPGAVARNVTKLAEGAGYAARLARHRVPYRLRSTVLEAHGDDQVQEVTTARLDSAGRVRPGTEERVAVDVLAVGWGFTPQLELPLALGCATRTDTDGSLVVVVDDEQRTTVGGIFVAGEACGVGGAALAAVEGRIAGAAAARALGHDAPVAARDRRQRTALRGFARAMHRTYPVPEPWLDRVTDDVLVCRCEEVSAGRLREVVEELGADDPRSAKLMARVGMGWCQGRVCGYPASCLVAHWTGTDVDPAQLASRPVATPVPLAALAGTDLDEPTRT
ncbi:MAG TPA: NAD(P)/FAD-dependent oxidoreductase [Actinomycetales bacterium]|nr:NAD(P)/FAD-dependent oxidoreductase [Actinomycetales bacterium]